MTGIVNAVLVRDGKVLLARRAAGRATYPNCWSFPGGHVEAGESLDQALAREMREEIGVAPSDFARIATIVDPADPRITYHMYLVHAWTGGEPTLSGDEHSELRWIARAEAGDLDDLALPDYRSLLARLGG